MSDPHVVRTNIQIKYLPLIAVDVKLSKFPSETIPTVLEPSKP